MSAERHGIYPHSEQRQATHRGFVVRPCDKAGNALDTFNYGGIPAVSIYARAHAAQRRCDLLNATQADSFLTR